MDRIDHDVGIGSKWKKIKNTFVDIIDYNWLIYCRMSSEQ